MLCKSIKKSCIDDNYRKKIKNRNLGGILEKLTSPRQNTINREVDRVKNKEPATTH